MASLLTHWFTPHYTNNHRPKLLQPVGLVVVIALFLSVQTTIQLLRLSPPLPGGLVLGYASDITATQVVNQTNAERTKAGLPPLTVDSRLTQSAVAKANHMFQYDYWAHIAPDGTTPWFFIKQAGYTYSVAGENLARDFGDTTSMVQAWMNSPTHRANLLHPKFTNIGVAVVNGTLQGVQTTLVVQEFGAPALLPAKTSDQGAVSNQPIPVQSPVLAEESSLTPAQNTPVPVNATQTNDKVYVSPLIITKVVASILVVLLVMVLLYDLIMASKQNLPRRVSNNWAHLGLFSVVLLIIIVISQGKVL